MKKLLSLICSLSLSAALLAGCSSTPQEPTVSQTPSDSETPTTSQSVTTEAVDVKVMALKGPTAMGMVQFMSETDNGSITDNNYDFIIVYDKVSGLYGKFYIESDTHTFTNGKSEMQLTLAFSNLMDEKEITTA